MLWEQNQKVEYDVNSNIKSCENSSYALFFLDVAVCLSVFAFVNKVLKEGCQGHGQPCI